MNAKLEKNFINIMNKLLKLKFSALPFFLELSALLFPLYSKKEYTI
jgi:hypothetical protein